MSTRTLDPFRIIFDLNIELPKTARYPAFAKDFLGELIIEGENIALRVYYENNDMPNGLMDWEGTYAHTLLSCFKVTEIHSPEHLVEISFGNYNYTGMHSSTGLADPIIDQHFFTISLEGIRLNYKSNGESDSMIHLSETALKLPELYYNYSSHFYWDEEFSWEPKNQFELTKFGEIDFILEHNFYQGGKSSESEVRIKKDPRIRIKGNALSHEVIAAHRDLLCVLFSFYTNKRIDWTVSRIKNGDYLLVERRKISGESVAFIHGLFIWDFIQNPMNLINNVSVEKLLKNLPIVSSLVERYNYSFRAPEETKFMILYSILEQVRNEYILDGSIEQARAGNPPDLKKVKEEFSFSLENSEVNSLIRSALEQLIPHVKESDREKYKAELSSKVSFIKLFTMTGQFESLFEHLDVDPAEYDLDFKVLKRLRDQIFHGKLLSTKDISYLKQVNWYSNLPTLTGVLLIKYFGISDLKKITKKRSR